MQTNFLINTQINSSLNQFENQNNTRIVQSKMPQNTSETSEKKVKSWSQIASIKSDPTEKQIPHQNRVIPTAEKTNSFVHENGIFGSYCLEDVKSIATLVLKTQPTSRVNYDCFNYETVTEILDGSKKGGPATRINLFKKNNKILKNMVEKNKIGSCNLYYSNTHNDLLQTIHAKVKPIDQWHKFKRRYKKNMVFFNPYLGNKPNTEKLINAFFKYAETNLDNNGVVTMMWNPNRKDSLVEIDVVKLAKEHEFKLISQKSGEDFAQETNFVHLKNSTSLDRSLSDSASGLRSSDVVSSKNDDILYIFKKTLANSKIPDSNEIGKAFASLKDVV